MAKICTIKCDKFRFRIPTCLQEPTLRFCLRDRANTQRTPSLFHNAVFCCQTHYTDVYLGFIQDIFFLLIGVTLLITSLSLTEQSCIGIYIFVFINIFLLAISSLISFTISCRNGSSCHSICTYPLLYHIYLHTFTYKL